MPDVAPLRRDQTVGKVIAVRMIDQQFGKSLLRQYEKSLVVPKGVVRIESDCLQFLSHPVFSPATSPFSAPTVRLYNGVGYMETQGTNRCMTDAVMIRTWKLTGTPPDDGEGDAGVVVETKPKTKRPPLYKVLLLNDDYTPMEFVVHVLERFFGMTHAQAFEIMLTVHKKGVAVVGVFSHEIAETKVGQVMDFARRHQHPLQCTMEKE